MELVPKDKEEASEAPEAPAKRSKSASSARKAAPVDPPQGTKDAFRDPQCRHAVFTLNNYKGLPDASLFPHATFVVFSEEIGDKGTPHIQGYVQFGRQVRISMFTKHLRAAQGFHAVYTACARGSDEENVAYCTKEEGRLGGPYWFQQDQRRAISGVKGGRNDILAVKKEMESGKSLGELVCTDASASTIVRNLRGLQFMEANISPRRTNPTLAIVLWGSTGCGKSTTARALAEYLGGRRHFPVAYQKGSGLYFDGYRLREVPIFDEMDGSRCDPKFFNMLCDSQPMTVPIHGGSANFNSPYAVFTTNKHPSRWWPNAQTPGAVRRRMIILPVFVKNPGALNEVKRIKVEQERLGISNAPTMSTAQLAEVALQVVLVRK